MRILSELIAHLNEKDHSVKEDLSKYEALRDQILLGLRDHRRIDLGDLLLPF